MQTKALLLAALVPFLWACEDATGPEGGERVAVRFQAVTATGVSASRMPGVSASLSGASRAAVAPITLTGGGNTLVIEDIRLIVAEIELKRAGVVCVGEDDDDDCEEFEGGPFLVNLLDGTADEVVTGVIPAGAYTELEFEVENLDADEDDDSSERQAMQSVLTQVRQAYPSFPNDASMVVKGTYNGAPFTVYFDAEIEVEKEFATPFQVPGGESILVNLNPAAWFLVGGQPLNLAALDGRTVEFELEFESGIEIEDDD